MNAMRPVRELPPDYSENLHYVLTEPGRIVKLNIAALLPLLLAIPVMAGWWAIIAPMRTATANDSFALPWWLGVIAVFLIVLPVHELFHGIAIQALGHRARYGIKLDKGVLYATADRALFRRNEYIVIALAPIVGITLLGMVLMLVLPEGLVYYIALGVAFNAGGAVGDLWATAVVLRYPAGALIRDEEDGFRVYMPE